jgi:hypothetical protein
LAGALVLATAGPSSAADEWHTTTKAKAVAFCHAAGHSEVKKFSADGHYGYVKGHVCWNPKTGTHVLHLYAYNGDRNDSRVAAVIRYKVAGSDSYHQRNAVVTTTSGWSSYDVSSESVSNLNVRFLWHSKSTGHNDYGPWD